MSKFLLHLFAAFAEMERGTIREPVQAGVRGAKAKGTRLGHPQRVVRRAEAQRLRQQGMSLIVDSYKAGPPTLAGSVGPPDTERILGPWFFGMHIRRCDHYGASAIINPMDLSSFPLCSEDLTASPEPVTEPARDVNQPAAASGPMLYCPVCSLELDEHHRKLFCERCGYYF
jgi:hypothetical protein